ncbi:MAG: hypothetical protein HQL19_08605, partial [Candidatus Omnitrophica bacterium]|nr:hypothetical protein [Candidatus Omnitrophota bacterium]
RMNQLAEAEALFRKVIYLAGDTAMAYFNLGNIYLLQKKFVKASKEFVNTIRLLEKKDKNDPVEFCKDFTAGFLIKACRNHLGGLKGELT